MDVRVGVVHVGAAAQLLRSKTAAIATKCQDAMTVKECLIVGNRLLA